MQSVKEFAKKIGKTPSYIYNQIRGGKIKATKRNGKYVVVGVNASENKKKDYKKYAMYGAGGLAGIGVVAALDKYYANKNNVKSKTYNYTKSKVTKPIKEKVTKPIKEKVTKVAKEKAVKEVKEKTIDKKIVKKFIKDTKIDEAKAKKVMIKKAKDSNKSIITKGLEAFNVTRAHAKGEIKAASETLLEKMKEIYNGEPPAITDKINNNNLKSSIESIKRDIKRSFDLGITKNGAKELKDATKDLNKSISLFEQIDAQYKKMTQGNFLEQFARKDFDKETFDKIAKSSMSSYEDIHKKKAVIYKILKKESIPEISLAKKMLAKYGVDATNTNTLKKIVRMM